MYMIPRQYYHRYLELAFAVAIHPRSTSVLPPGQLKSTLLHIISTKAVEKKPSTALGMSTEFSSDVATGAP